MVDMGEAEEAEEAVVLETVADLAAELHRSAPAPHVRLDSLLDADLGLDSLALVELRARLEQAFEVVLPDRALALAATPGDWSRAVRAAGGSGVREVALPTRAPSRRPIGEAVTAQASWPSDARTLFEALTWHLSAHPEWVHLRILEYPDASPVAGTLTYGEVWEDALVLASGLQHHGLSAKEAVAIMLPTGRDYFATFMGVLVSGAIPVPLYPPARPAGLEDHLRRQLHILDNARATLLVTNPAARPLARLLRAQVPSLRAVLSVDQLRADAAGKPVRPLVDAEDIALLQYTSGSTGHPKGVVLTHRHLLANIAAMGAGAGAGPSDVFVSWLPLYHDMGLIAAWLGAVCFGFELVVMSPVSFLACPTRWLAAIDAYKGTITASPNFGYELCLRYVSDAELAGLDLSSWRLAFNGAEPVSPETIRRFAERFGPAGFRPEAMTPVYGLAEAGVALTFPPLGRGPRVDGVDRHALTHSGRAQLASRQDPAAQRFVACGYPLPGYRLRVVDASGHELSERHEGRIEFTGPSATPGYFAAPEESAALFHDGWLDTGDLGYVAEGELYLTGRTKDIIIRAGRNLHPEELEDVVGALAGVRKGCVAVFSSPDPTVGTERLVVLAETRLGDSDELSELRQRITSATVEVLGTPPDEVVLAPPGTVLKTSSGKIRRSASRSVYEQGDLGRRPSARLQVARFVWRSTRCQLRGLVRVAEDLVYAAYAWGLVVVIGMPTWFAVLVLPRLRWRWRVLQGAGSLLAWLGGIKVALKGSVPETQSLIVVANHASFVDGLVVILALKSPAAFVAGGELATQRIAGPFLRKLDCEFVPLGDPVELRAMTDRLAESLQRGRRFVFFPEGSLSRAPGLRRFHLGAFVVAASSGVPVVPVAVVGSRHVLRPGGKFPRRGAVSVLVADAIVPSGEGWAAAVALRDRAREAIGELNGDAVLAD